MKEGMGYSCLILMDENKELSSLLPSGDDFIKMLEALSNPHRLQIIALLQGRRIYVSQLAREMEMSRPLLYMHLKRLENAGLVASNLELSEDGKAMNYYEITPFYLQITPENIAEVTKTLTIKKSKSEGKRK
ncbi:ArsR/SmtB family transcription factor [Rossellomorea aquimaris]|jgi:DNA-binding transcriptional ArsR family regulator|uniref:ArsR/SmtB family transcription factor n=2 Tax=Bacillaceae TaxID=186817 RepID=UPI003CE93BE9